MIEKKETLWKEWNRLLQFLTTIPSSELRLHVEFLYFIGTPVEIVNNFSKIPIREILGIKKRRTWNDFIN